jgi:uncharacterized membrane protein
MPIKEQPERKTSKQTVTSELAGALEAETKTNVNKIVEIEKSHLESRTVGEKISSLIAAFCGSMTFVWVHVIWFSAWILLNSVFTLTAFDPFPYTFLTLVVSLEAIFLSTFILISQNHETELTERRNHLDLQINMLTEQENTKMLELLQLIAKKVGVSAEDPAMDALLEPMEPEKLIEQIMSAKDEAPKDGNAKK